MKAIKLTKIEWNTEGVSDEIKNNLPTVKGFLADDDFNVCEKAFGFLKNKFGVDAKTFNFMEYRVAKSLDELLLFCTPKGVKEKYLWTGTGNLSAFGKICYARLQAILNWNVELRRKETPEEKIPKVVDEVLLGIEKVLGIDSSKATIQEMMKAIDSKIKDAKCVNLKDADEDENDEDED